MNIIYAREALPKYVVKSIFLAGPSPRDKNAISWRLEALKILSDLGFDGHVFVPEDRSGEFKGDYTDQIEWESNALKI